MKKQLTIAALALSPLLFTSCDDDDIVNNTPTARNLQIRFEASGPNAFAPIFFATHDGDFDFFNTGSAATSQLETLAELGNVTQVLSQLKGTDNSVRSTAPLAVGGNITLTLNSTTANRYFSFGSMLLPSSDAFIGNNNPRQYDLNQLIANSNGRPIVINVTRAYDAGTEVNDFLTSPGGPLVGAPTGVATNGVAENGVISLITPPHFANYRNPGTFNAASLDSASGAVIGTITITVLP